MDAIEPYETRKREMNPEFLRYSDQEKRYYKQESEAMKRAATLTNSNKK